MRFGLVGQGGWGLQHARAIVQEGGTLAWVVGQSPTPDAAIAALDVPYYQGYDLDRLPRVDIVDLVVPNVLHASYAMAALSRGYHVLLEKPMATQLDDARALIQAYRASEKVLAIGYEMRFSPLWAKVRDLIHERIPDWQWIDASLERHPFRVGKHGWRSDPMQVGDWTIEEAVHHFDLLSWIGRRDFSPVTVTADYPGSPPPMADLCSATLRYRAGGMATYRSILNAEGHHLVVTAYASRGSIRAEWHGVTDRTNSPQMSVVWRENGRQELIPIDELAGEVFELNREIRAMIAAVDWGSSLWITPEAAYWNLVVSHAVIASGREGVLVTADPDEFANERERPR